MSLTSKLKLLQPVTKQILKESSKIMSSCSWNNDEHYRDNFKPGIYVCSECDHKLFSSQSKFEHSTPWPAFTQTISENSVIKNQETPKAFKVLCGNCKNGLGHEFLKGGPDGVSSRF